MLLLLYPTFLMLDWAVLKVKRTCLHQNEEADESSDYFLYKLMKDPAALFLKICSGAYGGLKQHVSCRIGHRKQAVPQWCTLSG